MFSWGVSCFLNMRHSMSVYVGRDVNGHADLSNRKTIFSIHRVETCVFCEGYLKLWSKATPAAGSLQVAAMPTYKSQFPYKCFSSALIYNVWGHGLVVRFRHLCLGKSLLLVESAQSAA